MSAVPLYKATNSALDVPPSPFPVAVLPPPTAPSLSPCLCSPRGRDHGHASHHGTEQGTGGGIEPHDEPQAVLQDPGKHPTGDARSCVCVAASLGSADAPGPGSEPAAEGLKQDTAPLSQMCNQMWEQRRFGNRRYRRDTEETVCSERGEVANRGMGLSFEGRR